MMININSISSFQDALNLRLELAPKQTSGWHFLYRGHSSDSYKLLSTIGRKKPINGILSESEISCLQDFMSLDNLYKWDRYRVATHNKDLFYMAAGRHLELDSRLLDWTAKLETALYFASSAQQHQGSNGCLWVLCYKGSIDCSAAKLNPFEVKDMTIVKEATLLPDDLYFDNIPEGILRRERQNGFFTITPTADIYTPLNKITYENIRFVPITVLASAKKNILTNLSSGYNDYLHLTSCVELQNDVMKVNAKYFRI